MNLKNAMRVIFHADRFLQRRGFLVVLILEGNLIHTRPVKAHPSMWKRLRENMMEKRLMMYFFLEETKIQLSDYVILIAIPTPLLRKRSISSVTSTKKS